MINCLKFYWLLICRTPHPDPQFYLAEKPECRFSRYEAQTINIERAGQHQRSNEPHREIFNEMVCTPSKDSDQPGHPPSLITVFTVRLKTDRILSYSLSALWRLIRLGIRPLQADLSLRWAYYGRVIFGNDAVENFFVCVCLGQVLDFTKSLVYSNCQNDRKCCWFFFFFFFFFRLCAMYAFYHFYVCLSFRWIWCFASIICKKGSFENTVSKAAVLLSLFMRDNDSCDIPHAA